MQVAREITTEEPSKNTEASKEELRAKRLANLKRFPKGQSGNPSGRSKVSFAIVDEAQKHAEKAIKSLVRVLDDEEAPAAAKISAANSILDRAYGKAPQAIDLKAEVNFSDAFETFIRSLMAGHDAKVIDGNLEE